MSAARRSPGWRKVAPLSSVCTKNPCSQCFGLVRKREERRWISIFVLQVGFFATGVGDFAVSLGSAHGWSHLVNEGVSLALVLLANLCVCLVLGVVWQERLVNRRQWL